MAAKKKPQTANRKPKSISQPALIEQLVDAGHELEGFSRKGDHLVIRLTPADLTNDAGGFIALDVCDANELQARCSVFAQQPQNLLILTVRLPVREAASQQPTADSSETSPEVSE